MYTGLRSILRQECHSKFKRLPTNSEMAETQLPEHSGRSGLDHENGLSREVPGVYDLYLSTGVVERYRREPTYYGGWDILKNCTAYICDYRPTLMQYYSN